jgi:hypothetical protein
VVESGSKRSGSGREKREGRKRAAVAAFSVNQD